MGNPVHQGLFAKQQRGQAVRWLGAGTLEPDALGVAANGATSSLTIDMLLNLSTPSLPHL